MKQRKLWVSIVAGFLALLMVCGVLFTVVPVLASAASSSALKTELDNLQEQADEIAAQSAELAQQIGSPISISRSS